MNPAPFKQANCKYVGPKGSDVGDIPVFKGKFDDGDPAVITCFEVSPEDILRMEANGRLWLVFHSTELPPIAVTTNDPFEG